MNFTPFPPLCAFASLRLCVKNENRRPAEARYFLSNLIRVSSVKSVPSAVNFFPDITNYHP